MLTDQVLGALLSAKVVEEGWDNGPWVEGGTLYEEIVGPKRGMGVTSVCGRAEEGYVLLHVCCVALISSRSCSKDQSC